MSRALAWLVDNLDQPQIVTTGCAQLGPAIAALGVPPERLEHLSTLLVDALRANAAPLPPEQRAAWQAASRLAARWMAQGAVAAAYEPPFWTGTVIRHDQRRQDLAVLLVRTLLPYPYLTGQHAIVETEYVPRAWRPCWLATPPASDNLVELHIRSGPADMIGAALVGSVRPGDQLRLRPAQGRLLLDPTTGGELLMIAEDTGVAAMRALLAELRQRRDCRPTRLLWLIDPTEEPYDLAFVEAYRTATTSVTTVPSVPALAAEVDGLKLAADTDAFVAGTPTGVAAVLTMLAYAGVPADRIRYDEIGADD